MSLKIMNLEQFMFPINKRILSHFWWGNVREIEQLEDPNVDGWIISR
jgi:hypothetical protein